MIILDEPTTGLDPNQLVEIRNLIKDIGRDKTLILSTHIMQEVEAICDKVVIIHKGSIVAQDLLRNLKTDTGLVSLVIETEESLEKSWFDQLPAVLEIRVVKNNEWEFLTEDAVQLRKELLSVVQERDLSLLSLRKQEKNLETIFRQLTQD